MKSSYKELKPKPVIIKLKYLSELFMQLVRRGCQGAENTRGNFRVMEIDK
jgi:hypothetical protein